MCFDNSDYEWVASINETTSGCSPLVARCNECGSKIEAGQWRKHVYQQESEECYRCEELDEGETCDEHDYGETFEYDCCEMCEKILRAIEQFELRNGCKVYEARPMLGDLKEEINKWNRDDAGLYAAVAIETYPEVGSVTWLLDVLVDE